MAFYVSVCMRKKCLMLGFNELPRYTTVTLARHKSSYIHHIGADPLQYKNLGQVLATAADRWPDRPAVISRHENKTLTYEQLLIESDKLAAALTELGLNPGDRLGIWSPNSTQWIVAMMAAARAGIISVAINPSYQHKEIKYCLKKVDVNALIVPDRHKTTDYYKMLCEVIPELPKSEPGNLNSQYFKRLRSVIMVTEQNDLKGILKYDVLASSANNSTVQKIQSRTNDICPDSACNIQFTSGTTGDPKAALLSNFNVVNNGYAVGKRNELGNGLNKICLQVPLFHVFGVVVSVSAAIQHGATLVLPSASYSPKANVEALLAEKCSVVHGTPTMHIDLVAEVRARGIQDLRANTAVTGGAAVSPQLVKDLASVLKLQRVKSVFGMTECTAVSFQSLPEEDSDRPLHFLGHIHDHLQAKVVDEENNIVPFGKPGQLMIKGYSLMMQYWGDEEKTQNTIDSHGWLQTGDQVILYEDGYARFVGRLKDLIIRGGENIAPKELEDLICTHPDVLECHVFGVPDARLGEEICAAVTVKQGVKLTLQDVNKFCSGRLAEYKKPRILKIVDSFPKTTSGKIQKFKLKEFVESGVI